MELIYTYGTEDEKAMKKLLDEEFWKRLGPTVRDCKTMGLDKAGSCIYIKATEEMVAEARKHLEGTPAKELTGEDANKLLKAFRDEAEAAEAGMGAIFG
ncbi:MAG: hypothetical protein A4E48_02784 [Methanosaeta sp. PtaU1.Bin060]|nr:MAG: hypothetical protein A4E48_02784 [Methanosaeta sp. PtaU1.Bin060]